MNRSNFVKAGVGEKLDKTIQSINAGSYWTGSFWGSVLLASKGEVLLAKGYGYADYGQRPNCPATLFDIAHISQWFTAAAILKLQEQGKLCISDSLTKYAGSGSGDKESLRIQDLLTHRSGISPSLSIPYPSDMSREELLDLVLNTPLECAPGANLVLSHTGYAVLAALIEIASGESFEQYMRREIFEAAQMFDTGFIGDKHLDNSRAAARLYEETKFEGTAVDYGHLNWGLRGRSGIVTTAYDLYNWDRSLAQGNILDHQTQEMQMNTGSEYHPKILAAMGCFVDISSGKRRVFHRGTITGFTTLFSRYPDDDFLIVVLGNNNAAVGSIETAIMDHLTLYKGNHEF